MKALVIEDQEDNASFLVKGLSDHGFTVDWEKDSAQAIWKANFTPYDVIISDFYLPHQNGLEILRALRQKNNHVPFIMLSVEKETEIKLAALKAGADDYQTKPFSMSELIARIRAVIRRGVKLQKEVLHAKDIELDPARFRVYHKKKEVILRRKEFDLLYYLMQNPGQVLSRSLILEKVWDMNADPFTNTVDVHIKNLRAKISDTKGEIIRTIYGRGYELSV